MLIFTLIAMAWHRWSDRWSASFRNRPLTHNQLEANASAIKALKEQQVSALSAYRQKNRKPKKSSASIPIRTWSLGELQAELSQKQAGKTNSNQPAEGTPQLAKVKRKLTKEEQEWLKTARELCQEVEEASENRECIRSYMNMKLSEKKKALADAKRKKAAGQDLEDSLNDLPPQEATAGRGYGNAGGGIAAGPNEDNNDNDENSGVEDRTLEEWEALLLESPNFGLVTLFIYYYDIQAVTPDIFYPVVLKMSHDKRVDMQRLGIMALSSSPSHRSFEELVNLAKNTSHLSPTSELIRKAIDRYALRDRIHFLNSILRGNGPEPTQLEVLQIITKNAPSLILAPKPITKGKNDVSAQAVARTVREFELILLSIEDNLKSTQISAKLKSSLSQTQDLLIRLLEQPQVAFR
jgi:hypothetical protein